MISRFALVGLAVAGLAAPASAATVRSGGDGISDETGLETPARPETRRHRHRGARRTAPPPAGPETTSTGGLFVPPLVGSDAGETARPSPVRTRRTVRRRPEPVVVLPPLRPGEDSETGLGPQDVPDQAGAERTADRTAVSGTSTAGLAAGITAGPNDPVAATIIRTVHVTPPLRPSIGNPTQAADAQTDEPDAARPIVTASLDPASVPKIFTWIDPAAGPASVVGVLPPTRPAFRDHKERVQTAALESDLAVAPPTAPAEVPAAAPAPPSLFGALFGRPPQPSQAPSSTVLPELSGAGHHGIDAMIEAQARANGVPVALVHRVVIRESRYNPRAVGRGGALGLMQIKHATARALGYDGPPSGLLDANTNLTYAVKYLAGAYRTAGGNFDRAVGYYARGYYYAAKRQGLVRTAYRHGRHSRYRQEADATPTAAPAALPAPAAPAERASDSAR